MMALVCFEECLVLSLLSLLPTRPVSPMGMFAANITVPCPRHRKCCSQVMSFLQCAQQIGSAFNTHSGQRTQPLATRLDSTVQTQCRRDQFAINFAARQTSCCFHLLRKRADTGHGFCSPPKLSCKVVMSAVMYV